MPCYHLGRDTRPSHLPFPGWQNRGSLMSPTLGKKTLLPLLETAEFSKTFPTLGIGSLSRASRCSSAGRNLRRAQCSPTSSQVCSELEGQRILHLTLKGIIVTSSTQLLQKWRSHILVSNACVGRLAAGGEMAAELASVPLHSVRWKPDWVLGSV